MFGMSWVNHAFYYTYRRTWETIMCHLVSGFISLVLSAVHCFSIKLQQLIHCWFSYDPCCVLIYSCLKPTVAECSAAWSLTIPWCLKLPKDSSYISFVLTMSVNLQVRYFWTSIVSFKLEKKPLSVWIVQIWQQAAMFGILLVTGNRLHLLSVDTARCYDFKWLFLTESIVILSPQNTMQIGTMSTVSLCRNHRSSHLGPCLFSLPQLTNIQ